MHIEKDAIGELEVPDDVYYGIQTVRVSGNYAISKHTYNEHTDLIRAVAEVKKACAMTNAQIQAIDPAKAQAIVEAADELIAGKFDGQFIVNVWRSQGTGVNMNVNEVLANRANEILTGHRGYDTVHPNSHVNMGQSSNDVFPTAEAIVLYRRIGKLAGACRAFEEALAAKAREFEKTVRLGRTGLQDAVPMTWGQVFGGWQSMFRRSRLALENARGMFQNAVLGATVLGTGMGQQPGYSEHVYENLSKVVGFEIRWAHMDGEAVPDSAVFDGMRNTDHHMALMALVRGIATSASRIAHDLILYSSGPECGLGEVHLPAIGPGYTRRAKVVNPYIPQMVIDVAHQVLCADQMAIYAANEGQQDHGSVNSGAIIAVLNAMTLVENVLGIFAKDCIAGVRINEERCRRNAELSTSLSTMVSALYGYPTGVRIAKLASAEGISCKEAALREKLLPADVAEDLFDVAKLADRRATVEMFRKYGKFRKIS